MVSDGSTPAAPAGENTAPITPLVASAPIEADTNTNDTDSSYGDEVSVSSTSITSSILAHVYENGRRYHAYRPGEYPLPDDDKEQDRLDLLHHIWKLLLGGKLYTASLPPNLQRVLDFGTGTGIWAIDFADEFPSAKVIGTDLSPIQPSWVPPNCTFYVDDSELAWTFGPDDAFDFIHGRAMGGSVRDWPALYSEIYMHLKPGGWVEIQEYETWCRMNNEKEELPTALLQWQTNVNAASEKFGKKMLVAGEHKDNMIAAGFVDVQDIMYKVPIGGWPKEPKAKQIGLYERMHMLDAVEPFSLALFSRSLGWTKEEIMVLVAQVRQDFANPKYHMFSYFHFVSGRKPETATS